MKTRFFFLFLSVCILIVSCKMDNRSHTELRGKYMNQPSPGDTPQLFAPHIISSAFQEKCSWFTPENNEFYFAVYGSPMPLIMVMKRINNKWTTPEVASFSDLSGGEFTISPDGKKVFFMSFRPIDENKKEFGKKAHFWMAERSTADGKWGKPQLLKEALRDVGYICAASSGNLYYFDYELAKYGKADILMSEYRNGKYSDPINLGPAVNSEFYNVDPYIAPDESYLIFSSNRSPSGLYISYRQEDNSWSEAIYMGDKINKNIGDGAICAAVSPDGKYLFFTANPRKKHDFFNKKITYEEKMRILNSPQNGENDIYWVSANIIKKLRPQKKQP